LLKLNELKTQTTAEHFKHEGCTQSNSKPMRFVDKALSTLENHK